MNLLERAAMIQAAQAKAVEALPPAIAKSVIGQLQLMHSFRPDAGHDDELRQLINEVTSLSGAEKTAAEMRQYIGQQVDMSIGVNGMSGEAEHVDTQVLVVLDYGYAMNAMHDGFVIKDLADEE